MEVCLRGGFSQSFYAQIESGKAHPSALTVIRIAAALGVNARDFFPESPRRSRDDIKRQIASLLESL